MKITLQDGNAVALFDIEKMAHAGSVVLNKHCMRFHIYEPGLGVATKHFSTSNRKLQNAILEAARAVPQLENSWVRSRLSRKELWPSQQYERMALRDLENYWGDNVTLRGTALRYIWYVSDGSMENTPDAIGMAYGRPLIYKGYAVATIFDIAQMDPLQHDRNIVFWLSKPMWESFHHNRRGAAREFPWPTGFVCSYWCQRDGYANYRKGIHLASMTQGQTVGSWSASSLPLYWRSVVGRDIFHWAIVDEKGSVDKGKSGHADIMQKKKINHYSRASVQCPYGIAAIRCPFCGEYLWSTGNACKSCGKYIVPDKLYSGKEKEFTIGFCKTCGNNVELCHCGDDADIVFLDREMYNAQSICIRKTVIGNYKKDIDEHELPF